MNAAEKHISIENLSLEFFLHHEKGGALKQRFASMFKRNNSLKSTNFWALKNINLSFKTGDRVGIIGHNGAGKSTLLKTICNIYEPTQGYVRVKGRIAPLLEIGAGFQSELSGRDNIYLNGAILGYTRQQIEAIEEEIIVFTQLREFIDTPVKYYSTGMYMKLGFAIATAIPPEILILDELFAGGDAEFITSAEQRMTKQIDSASIFLFVSHQEDLIQRLCDRVIWLEQGQIKYDGSTSTVLSAYRKERQRG